MRRWFSNLWMKLGLLVVLFVVAYFVPLKGIITTWMTEEDYSYGFFIPAIAGYLIWKRKDDLTKQPVQTDWRWLPAVCIVMLVSAYGILGSSGNVSRPLIPISLIALSFFSFGRKIGKILLAPLAFLIFMVPVPAFLERTLGMSLKRIASIMGGEFVRLCGIPVHVSGNVIDLGTQRLQVVDACSGIRYLFPLMALGFVYAYLYEKSQWKRVLLFLSTIPISVVLNGGRIGITGLLGHFFGAGITEGFSHDFAGWVVFMIAFFILILEGKVLAKFAPKSDHRKIPTTEPDAVGERSSRGFMTAIVLLVALAAVTVRAGSLPPLGINGGIERFPTSFAGWEGRQEFIDADTVKRSGAEQSFLATFSKEDAAPISLYIGYRSSAFLENENFFHSPTVCLPSSGWEASTPGIRTITGVDPFGSLAVSEMVIEREGTKELVYFWFQTKSRTSHDKNINRFHLSLHALARDNTHDVFLRLITPMKPGEKITDAELRMDEFLKQTTRTLSAFLKERQVRGA